MRAPSPARRFGRPQDEDRDDDWRPLPSRTSSVRSMPRDQRRLDGLGMDFVHPQLLGLVGAAPLMVWLGLAYRRLEPRRQQTRCAACGRYAGPSRPCGCRD